MELSNEINTSPSLCPSGYLLHFSASTLLGKEQTLINHTKWMSRVWIEESFSISPARHLN